jgi:PKD repeat protein
MWATRKLPVVIIAIVLLVTAGAGAGRAIDPGPVADAVPQTPTTTSPSAAPPMSPVAEVSTTGSDNREPDVAYNTQFDEYLVVWEGNKTIWGRRVSSRGQPIGLPFLVETGATYGYKGPRVAYDSQRNRYLVVWGRLGGSADLTLHGRFVPALGPISALSAFAIDPLPLPDNAVYSLAYALAQDEFLVVWARKTGGAFREATYGRRIRADGSGFPASTFLLTEHATDNRMDPDVAYNLQRNEYLVTVDDHPKVDEDIYGVRLTAGGIVLGGGEFGIAGWPDDEQGAAVAACPTGDQYLAAWHSIQIQANTDGLYARFVAGNGSPGAVVQLAHYDFLEWHRSIDAACGVTNQLLQAPRYLVAWAKYPTPPHGSCQAREVFSNGDMGDPVQITEHCRDLAVAGGAMNHLVVFDRSGHISARIVGNTRPEASFTVTPQEGDSTTVFQFDASGSTDATDDPGHLQVRWDWDNNDVYDTAWSSSKTASHQFSLADWQSQAVYIVQLQVTDGHGASDTATREVMVRNAPPAAAFTITPTSGDTSTSFHFDTSASSDPEGGALEVRWDWEDDGSYETSWSSAMTMTHTFPAPGIYTVRLQVRDNWEQADTTTRQVTVQAGSANTPPQASFTVNPPSGDTSTVFTFDASGSTDAEDGTPSEVRWDWNNNGIFEINWGTAKTIQHTFTTAGTHTVRLEVRDSGGLTDATTRPVPVGQPAVQHRAYLPFMLRSFP